MDRRKLQDLEDQERAREAQENGATSRGLPPGKKYRVDPEYARRPTAICELPTIGLPCCEKGEGRHCMWRGVCSHQLMSDGVTRTPQAEKLYQEEVNKALRHARAVSDKDPSFGSVDWEGMSQAMIEAGEDERRIKGRRRR